MTGDGADAPDFSSHNAEVREVWAAYRDRRPLRVPMVLGINPRYLICERGANALGVDFRTYAECPDAMFDAQLRFQHWTRLNLHQDAEMGLPVAWRVYVDFQNYYEAAWFGCPVEYRHAQVPDAAPIYSDDPARVVERGAPDPFSGVMGRAIEFYDRLSERAKAETFMGRPITAQVPGTGMGTDGPMTVACNLFSAGVVCEMMASEPERLNRLLGFITDCTIQRVAAWKDRFGVAYPHDGYGIADDSVALISAAAYRRHVLPSHRRLFDAFGTAHGRSIHLCGDATRHFGTIRDELEVVSFDTGYPVDFGTLRAEVGPEVELHGGPSAPFLADASADEVEAETVRILTSGVAQGGRFVLREGNNLAPGTPVASVRRMYDTVRRAGRYDAGGDLCILC